MLASFTTAVLPSLLAPLGGWPLLAAAGGGETAETLLELGLVVVALAAVGRLAGRLRFSPVPFYLLVGLLFGARGPLPLGVAEGFVEIGATIGVVLLLFMLGLEYTSAELRGSLATGWPAGLVDLALNLTPGVLFGLLLGWGPLAALLLGGVTYISSSGIIAKMLGDFRWLGNRETPAVLSVLVLEDLAMAVYLPLVAVLLVGRTPVAALASVTIAVACAAAALLLALRYGGVLSRALATPNAEALLLSALGVLLLAAGAAEWVQVSAGVGAFLLGVALTGEVAERVRELLGPLRDLFAAMFFVFFGLQIDPGGIPAVLGVTLLLVVVTALTKFATGWWAARRAGVAVRGRVRAGTALVARGEFSIVLAGLGVSAGLEPQLGAIAAAYVLITAVSGPLLARASEPIAVLLFERRVAPRTPPAPAVPAAAERGS